jgi:hypothetical protein
MYDAMSNPAASSDDTPKHSSCMDSTLPQPSGSNGAPIAWAVPLWVPVSSDGSQRRLLYVPPAQLSEFLDSSGALLPHVRYRAEDFDTAIHYDLCSDPDSQPPCP